MSEFNFTSAICTSRSQSERLLALGLKKETADMIHQPIGATPFNVWYKQEIEDDFYPAWSLHRLIEMALRDILICGISFTFNEDAYEKVIGIIEHQIKEGYFPKEYLV